MAKFTPGPWGNFAGMIVKFGEGGRNICELSSTDDGKVVKHVPPTYRTISDPELQANAALIAAAPDLVESLKDVLPFAKAHAARHNCMGKSCPWCISIRKADAAIAKAEGVSNG